MRSALALLILTGCTPPALATGLPHSLPMACGLAVLLGWLLVRGGYKTAGVTVWLMVPGLASS